MFKFLKTIFCGNVKEGEFGYDPHNDKFTDDIFLDMKEKIVKDFNDNDRLKVEGNKFRELISINLNDDIIRPYDVVNSSYIGANDKEVRISVTITYRFLVLKGLSLQEYVNLFESVLTQQYGKKMVCSHRGSNECGYYHFEDEEGNYIATMDIIEGKIVDEKRTICNSICLYAPKNETTKENAKLIVKIIRQFYYNINRLDKCIKELYKDGTPS